MKLQFIHLALRSTTTKASRPRCHGCITLKLLPTPSDKRAAALALLEILRPHIILTRSLYKRTVPGQKAPRDRLRRRLRLLGKHKDHIVEYEKQIKASDETPGTNLEGEKAEPRKSFTQFVERSLANDEYMAKGWFRRVAPRLPPDEQTRLFRESTAILLAKAREYETRGSAKSLQKRTISALLHDIDQSYRQLRILGHASIDTATLRRPFNPFHKSLSLYSTTGDSRDGALARSSEFIL